ncbi:hypothetical protein [Bradyrhizobium sp. STM 3562]|uniref:hypothetical protein n=1 Tax=Bradyrhizobium sp. STM 3562 TaxID=578924 RepID=UPI00389016D3
MIGALVELPAHPVAVVDAPIEAFDWAAPLDKPEVVHGEVIPPVSAALVCTGAWA